MTDLEINKTIHEKVMRECWHEFEDYRAIHGNHYCLKDCGYDRYNIPKQNPDYCSDLNAVHRAEIKAIERLSTTNKNPNVAYCRHLMVANGFNYDDLGYLYEQVIRATARQRAEAVLRATGNWEDK